jgi:hypothetical protein
VRPGPVRANTELLEQLIRRDRQQPRKRLTGLVRRASSVDERGQRRTSADGALALIWLEWGRRRCSRGGPGFERVANVGSLAEPATPGSHPDTAAMPRASSSSSESTCKATWSRMSESQDDRVKEP